MPLLICPNCQIGMKEIERDSVHVDICPQCRGVWLDRGELEKLLSNIRSAGEQWERHEARAPHPHSYGYGHGHSYKKHKKKPWDLFDFFD